MRNPENNSSAPVGFQFQLSDLLVFALSLGPIIYVLHGIRSNRDSRAEWHLVAAAFLAVGGTMLVGVIYANIRRLSGPPRVVELLMWNIFALPIGIVLLLALVALFPSISIIARNEDSARVACAAFAHAQDSYRRTDHDSDGALEYAPSLRALHETIPGTGNLNLLDLAFVEAENPRAPLAPKAGYYFKVLTSQGPNHPSGVKSYIDANGNMTQGYALLAYPVKYDVTGRLSFLISDFGTIYEKDLGPNSDTIAPTIQAFEPDNTWLGCEGG